MYQTICNSLRNTDILIVDLKKPSMMNQATWGKSSSKEEKKIQSFLARYPTIERNNAHSE